MNTLDESVIYQLMQAMNDLKKEMERLRTDIKELKNAVEENTNHL